MKNACYINVSILRQWCYVQLGQLDAANVTQLSKTEVNFYSLLIEIKAKYNGEKCKNQLLIANAWEQDY